MKPIDEAEPTFQWYPENLFDLVLKPCKRRFNGSDHNVLLNKINSWYQSSNTSYISPSGILGHVATTE